MKKGPAFVLRNGLTSSWGGSGGKLPVAKDPANGSLVGSMLGSVGSPGGGSGNRLIILLVAIVSITAVLGIAAARKQRTLHLIRR